LCIYILRAFIKAHLIRYKQINRNSSEGCVYWTRAFPNTDQLELVDFKNHENFTKSENKKKNKIIPNLNIILNLGFINYMYGSKLYMNESSHHHYTFCNTNWPETQWKIDAADII